MANFNKNEAANKIKQDATTYEVDGLVVKCTITANNGMSFEGENRAYFDGYDIEKAKQRAFKNAQEKLLTHEYYLHKEQELIEEDKTEKLKIEKLAGGVKQYFTATGEVVTLSRAKQAQIDLNNDYPFLGAFENGLRVERYNRRGECANGDVLMNLVAEVEETP